MSTTIHNHQNNKRSFTFSSLFFTACFLSISFFSAAQSNAMKLDSSNTIAANHFSTNKNFTATPGDSTNNKSSQQQDMSNAPSSVSIPTPTFITQVESDDVICANFTKTNSITIARKKTQSPIAKFYNTCC